MNRPGENEDYWDYLEENHREVTEWPEWKRGAQRCEPDEDGQTNSDPSPGYGQGQQLG